MLETILVALMLPLLGAGLYVYLLPIPPDIEIPWKLKFISIMMKLAFFLQPYIPARIKQILDRKLRVNMRSSGPKVHFTDTAFGGVPVRVYDDQPDGAGAPKRPGIVYFHGGGWTLGNTDMSNPLTSEIARTLGAVVVSVDYRLTPEFRFPSAINDSTAAVVGFLQHLQDFNVDPTRVAVLGESAGGNLAAAVAQRLTFDPRYKDLPKLKMQVLMYPCLQAIDFQTPSYQQYCDYKTLIVDRDLIVHCWVMCLNNRPDLQIPMSLNIHVSTKAKKSALVKKCLSHDLIPDEFKQAGYIAPSADFGDEDVYKEIQDVLLDPDFAPLMREDLRGLPEAYILTAEYDVLRDDGIMYAKRLERAGVPVTWKHYKKGYHGMFSIKDGPFASPSGDVAVADFFEFTREKKLC